MQMRIWKNYRRPALWPHRVSTVYRPLMLCCILLVAGFSLRTIFASALSGLDAGSPEAAPGVQQPTWGAEGAITMYGGAYTTVVGNLRFEPMSASSPHRKLVADLLYSNLSPFTVHVERNSRVQALVFAGDGSHVGTFVADTQDLPPGGAVQTLINLGTDYSVARYEGEQLSVLFADAGGNLAGWTAARLER